MPAKVVLPSDEPDLQIDVGELSEADFQDCVNIVQAYERGTHYSATDGSVFAPVSRVVQANKYWARSSAEILSSRLAQSVLVDSLSGKSGVATRTDSNTLTSLRNSKSLEEALKNLKDDCIPCDDRVRLSIEGLPTNADINFYLEDVRRRVKLLSRIDDLLGDVNVFRDLCPLLNVLNFMCVPDLQRIIAVLTASLFNVNFKMGDQFGLITSLILPILMPILSGLVNVLDQFSATVLSPMDCILDALLEQLQKLNVGGATQPAIDAIQKAKSTPTGTSGAEAVQAIGFGLNEMYGAVLAGRDHASAKLNFYQEALRKALSDWTGSNDGYMELAANKLRTVQLIELVASIISLKKKGLQLCQEGSTPSASELDSFFQNFLNKNSRLQFAMDPDGNIRVEEPGTPLYRIEKPNSSAKIITYEPEDLLTKPTSLVFKCSFAAADPDEVAKVNRWIKELQGDTAEN